MSKTTYEQMPALLKAKEEFEGNSVSARWERMKEGNSYVVYSYNTVMYYECSNGDVFYNDAYYSMTTRKIQCILKHTIPTLSDFEPQFTLGKRGGKHYRDTVALKTNGEWDYDYMRN